MFNILVGLLIKHFPCIGTTLETFIEVKCPVDDLSFWHYFDFLLCIVCNFVFAILEINRIIFLRYVHLDSTAYDHRGLRSHN